MPDEDPVPHVVSRHAASYTSRCIICYHDQPVPKYADWACTECGQRYVYEEGHQIELTEGQLELLREQQKQHRGRYVDDIPF